MKILLLILLATMQLSSTKTRIINIEDTMEKATTRQLITVYGYKDNIMLYGISSSKDTLKLDCHFREDCEKNRLLLIEAKAMKPTDLAGKWPDEGEKLLLVAEGTTLLFAKKVGTDYRFWDPKSAPYANSVFFMKKNGDYHPVGSDAGSDGYTFHCSDGCLAKKEYIDKKYNLK